MTEAALKAKITDLEARLNYTEAALTMSREFNEARDDADLLRILAQPAVDAGANQAALYYIDLDETAQPAWLELGAIWQREGDPVENKGDRYAIGDFDFIQLWLDHPDAPLTIEDITQDNRVDDNARQVFAASGHNATAVVPLRQAARWIGCLVFSWKSTHQWAEQETELYQILMGMGTSAVENWRLLLKQQQALEERERWQQQVIDQQQATLKQLSTPVIPLFEGVILLPLIGTIDTGRAENIRRSMLAHITQYGAQYVLLDVTGVEDIDMDVAQHINRAVQAAQLKGAQTVMTGISEQMAEIVVDLGINWNNIETTRDLQTGLGLVLARLDKTLHSR